MNFKLFLFFMSLFVFSGCGGIIDMSLFFTKDDYELITPLRFDLQHEFCDTNLENCMHFIFEIDTRLGDGFPSFTLPLTNQGTYDFYVLWGDDTYNHITSYTQFLELSHGYPEQGIYTIELIGYIEGFNFHTGFSSDAQKVINIQQWGGIKLGNQGAYFRNTINMQSTAIDSPNLEQTTNLSQMFYNSRLFNQDISTWDVNQVKEMDEMFHSAFNFNQNLTTWNVSSITTRPNQFSFISGLLSKNEPLWGDIQLSGSSSSSIQEEDKEIIEKEIVDDSPPQLPPRPSGGGSSKGGGGSSSPPEFDCYSSLNIGTIGLEEPCLGMLIVSEEMLRNATEIHNGSDRQIEFQNQNFTFGNSSHNIFTGQVTNMSDLFKNSNFNSLINY